MTSNATNQQLNFLQDKIREIGSAIFHNLSDSVLKLPTSIITTQEVDDYGFVWFFIQKPRQSLKEFEMEFPVRLDFFKKGSPCFMQVSGKGWVVNDPEELSTLTELQELGRQPAMDGMVLVKVKMMKVEYYETGTTRTSSWWQNALHGFTAWFKNSNFRPDIYYPAS